MTAAVPEQYYKNVRHEVLAHLADGPFDRVLEVGCGEGATLAAAREQGLARWVGGIELFPDAADVARSRLDQVWTGNIEDMPVPVEDESLDVILCLDVLEHLRDPWHIVAELHKKVRPGGRMIATIPNIRHRSVVLDLLLRGNFEYRDAGIMDRTHLRFFTRKTAIELMTGSGLTLGAVQALGAEKLARRWRGRWLLNTLTGGRAADFYTTQYLIVCHKGPRT